jgi:ribose-phosphate pyrophosphokinase
MKIEFRNENDEISTVIPVKSKYPDGQPHLTIDLPAEKSASAIVKGSIRNPDELFDLSLIMDILYGNVAGDIDAEIYWLFGARMDRRIDRNSPNTFDCVRDIVSRGFNVISVLDIHNPAVFTESQPLSIKPLVNKTLDDFGDCDIFFPDNGAKTRYGKLFQNSHSILTGSKKRDSKTGWLSDFKVEDGDKTKDSVLILDDICAGGYTFFGHSQALKNLGYKKVGLYTTHGIYSGDMSILKDFDGIYSSNSFQWDDQLLTLNKYKVVGKEMERISATPVKIS